jgi:poly(beta-D-mannuronate) lyase
MTYRIPASKLTRRGLLIIAVAGLAGAAEFVYLRETRGGGSSVLPKFRPIFVRPSEVIDLRSWKINLPVQNRQVSQPQLASFHGQDFKVITAVQFTAPCGGQPQPGSKYARSELREMNPDGSPASWSSTSGRHVMEMTQRITHLPVVKPQLVCGQIHSDTDYLIMIEIDAERLYVRYRDSVAGFLDNHYQLGTFFDVRIEAADGNVDVYYNGVHKVRQAMDESSLYFKAGCYVQSSTSTGDQPTAYGQVEISSLTILHS